ncbi:MAG TPA: DNA-3-methyladenine glycosylase [Dongiaceae bacterium]|nr:DNA-3-methyladenine glycosylase [Dongiaceae bacterium]
MARRRRTPGASRPASGPGNLTRALGITLRDSGTDLTRGALTIEPADRPRAFRIATGPRIGITRAVERPLRFWIIGNRFVSGAALSSRSDARSRPGVRSRRRPAPRPPARHRRSVCAPRRRAPRRRRDRPSRRA